MNKKGFATALVDFYATIAIVLIIIIFFVVLHFKTEKSTYEVTGEQIGLDATQIALLYAQTPVETTHGKMTFGEFLALTAEDSSLETEYIALTKNYFDQYCSGKLHDNGKDITPTIKITTDTKILTYTSCDVSLGFATLVNPSALDTSRTASISIPLHTPGMFAYIQITTNTINAEQLGSTQIAKRAIV